MKKTSFSTIVFSGILGILLFLVIVGVLNIISGNIGNPVLHSVVEFLNENLVLILLISIIILFGNIFEIFIFPFNIFYPLFNAIGGVLWITFIFRALILIDSLIGENLFDIFIPFYFIALVLVPIIVLIVGYVHVTSSIVSKKRRPLKKTKKSKIEWDDVGEEFKGALYNLGRAIKKSLEPEVKRKRKK